MTTGDLLRGAFLRDDGRGYERVRVLLIEDDPEEATLVRAALDDANWVDFEITVVDRLQGALESLSRQSCDVVLMDLSLPDSDGLASLDAVMPSAGAAAVVVMTDSASPVAAMAAVQRGAEDYVVKSARRGGELARSVCFGLERRRRAQRVERRANSDGLTGLANRDVFESALVLACGERGARNVGVLFLDVDNFKGINDRHGHAAGDEVLRELADRLIRASRSGDMVARRGGDEFVVLLGGADTRSAVSAAALRVYDAASRPLSLRSGETISLRVSVGAAAGAGDPSALLERADTAMYRAKRRSVGVSVADVEDDERRLAGPPDSDVLLRGPA